MIAGGFSIQMKSQMSQTWAIFQWWIILPSLHVQSKKTGAALAHRGWSYAIFDKTGISKKFKIHVGLWLPIKCHSAHAAKRNVSSSLCCLCMGATLACPLRLNVTCSECRGACHVLAAHGSLCWLMMHHALTDVSECHCAVIFRPAHVCYASTSKSLKCVARLSIWQSSSGRCDLVASLNYM